MTPHATMMTRPKMPARLFAALSARTPTMATPIRKMMTPTTKSELLAAASASFKKLTELWDGFTPEQAHAPFPAALLSGGAEAHWQRDKCLRDVVIHLHEWYNLVTVWVSANQAGTLTGFFLNRTRGVTTPRSTNNSSANIRIRPTKQLAISWRHHTSTYSV
jgi:hypothetical protein